MDVLFLACGVLVGIVLTLIATRVRRAGYLVVNIPDTDDPPYLSADL